MQEKGKRGVRVVERSENRLASEVRGIILNSTFVLPCLDTSKISLPGGSAGASQDIVSAQVPRLHLGTNQKRLGEGCSSVRTCTCKNCRIQGPVAHVVIKCLRV